MRKPLTPEQIEKIMKIVNTSTKELSKREFEGLVYYSLLQLEELTPEINNYYLFKRPLLEQLKKEGVK